MFLDDRAVTTVEKLDLGVLGAWLSATARFWSDRRVRYARDLLLRMDNRCLVGP